LYTKDEVHGEAATRHKHEIEELDLQHEPSYCNANGIIYLSLPIVDRGVPKSGREMLDFASRLKGFIEEGKNLVIHYRQGIGRSTVLAVAVLALRGMPAETAFDVIARARGCSVPDTSEQRDWVINMIKDISGPL
jgi:protein-tyrosine phosphatase